MFSFRDEVPDYLFGGYQLTATVVFTVLFSLLFVLFSIPYSNNVWFSLNTSRAFVFTIFFFLLSLAFLVASKRFLYLTGRRKKITFLHYTLWHLVEVLVISSLYTFFTARGIESGLLNVESRSVCLIFISAFAYVLVMLGAPCIIAAQYFALNDKDKTIRLLNVNNVVGDLPPVRDDNDRITLFDNNGSLKFSVSLRNLYYIESDDNYVQVWYKDAAGEMKQYMLRCRLKTIEDSFSESGLIRCHRKYMVNFRMVSVLRSEAGGYYIEFDEEKISPIPVSKTYEQAVLAKFNSR